MYCVYVLRSARNRKRYIGFTSRDVAQRVKEHNIGYSRWTSQKGPFDLVFVQECPDAPEARSLEKFLKSGQGRTCLNELGL